MPVETASGEAEAAESRGPGPGELLRGARCERGLSVEQVAENLHLDESIVEALEAERFDAVGAPVFVRGHLKAYARALQIEADTVLGAYRSTQPVDAAEPVLSRPVPTRSLAINPGPWAMGALGVVLAIGLAFYVLQEDPAPRRAPPPSPAAADTTEPDSVARVVPPPSEAAPPEPVAAAAPPDPPAADLPPPAEPVAILPAPAPAASEVPAPPSVAMPAARLELYFRGESWVEIGDADGRLLFGLQREGMRRQLSGRPPIQVLIGNAPEVDVYLDGEPYRIPPRRINGKVARFTIAAAAESGTP